jgi:hypothetical protein
MAHLSGEGKRVGVRKEKRGLRCCTCGLWIDMPDASNDDLSRMTRVGVKCGDCVTAAIIDYEEGD